MTKSLKISTHKSLWSQFLFCSNSSRWQGNKLFSLREEFFSLPNTGIESESKTKSLNVYFVIRRNIQFALVFFRLGKSQKPMLFYFSILYLLDLEKLTKSDRHICQRDALIYLRQCVIEVFCSTSTERSRKSSSLLLTCGKEYTCKTDLVKIIHPNAVYAYVQVLKMERFLKIIYTKNLFWWLNFVPSSAWLYSFCQVSNLTNPAFIPFYFHLFHLAKPTDHGSVAAVLCLLKGEHHPLC